MFNVVSARYDLVLEFTSHTGHEVVDAIEALVPVKQYMFSCRLDTVVPVQGAPSPSPDLPVTKGLDEVERTMAGDALKLVVDDHGIALSGMFTSTFTRSRRCFNIRGAGSGTGLLR